MIILSGDIGGTKTWLQIADYSRKYCAENTVGEDKFSVLFEQRYVSTKYASFDLLLEDFLTAAQREGVAFPEQACIGVAGPVAKKSAGNAIANVTNLPWQLDAQKLSVQNGIHRLDLINDFQAIAFGLELLGKDDVLILQKGNVSINEALDPKVVIGAGTGLGQALLVWYGAADNGRYEVISSEGGHCDFAPGSSAQRELLVFLAVQQSRVSVEDVLSGRGLVNIYRYVANKYPANVSATLQQAMLTGDAAAMISDAAAADHKSLAGLALNLFVEIYGTQAGNFALSCKATGGVYIAGGIAAKVQDAFTGTTFLAAFYDKGPMQKIMEAIPVTLVLDPQVGLKGAALAAGRL